MESSGNRVLVVGGNGTVGKVAVDHFAARPNWSVTGLSRNANGNTGKNWIAVDLRDETQCDEAMASAARFTHIVFAAIFEKQDVMRGWLEPDHAAVNLAMLKNIVTAAQRHSPDLRHISLIQGGRAYGKHLGPHRNPARERDPRYFPPNSYYEQEDWLDANAGKSGWTWTAFRPQSVWSDAPGRGAVNFVIAAGVFAAISRELGLPLRYPGAAQRIYEATDARLLAQAIEWAGDNPACGGECFNITNGDVFLFENLWERLASLFDMESGPPHPMSLNRIMPAQEDVWRKIASKHDLLDRSYTSMVSSWQFVDFALGVGSAATASHLSTIKIRKFGFGNCVDSEDAFGELITRAQAKRYLPQ